MLAESETITVSRPTHQLRCVEVHAWSSSQAWVTRLGVAGVIELKGAVDPATAGRVTTLLVDLARTGVSEFAVDLSGVVAADYSLCGSLARAHIAAKASDGHLNVIAGDHRILDVLHISGLDRLIAVFVGPKYRWRDGVPVVKTAMSRVEHREYVIAARGSRRHRKQHRHSAPVTAATRA